VAGLLGHNLFTTGETFCHFLAETKDRLQIKNVERLLHVLASLGFAYLYLGSHLAQSNRPSWAAKIEIGKRVSFALRVSHQLISLSSWA
jgi:hypothetical protein